MSDTKDLIERLRDAAGHDSGMDLVAIGAQSLMRRAAATIARLEAANEAFGKRQTWWTDRMFELEQKVDRLEAENERQSGVIRSLNGKCDHLGMTLRDIKAERDAARRDGMRAAASILEAEHDKRSHLDNHAAYYARMIRDSTGQAEG